MEQKKMFDIESELKKLPSSPGVYIMHDAADTIIYVGKAILLKNRVKSYFRKSTKKTAKIEKMVSQIESFEYIVTDSELEALVLENNLIKEYSPKYNTMLKDDKTYPYIKVTVGEPYPRILFSREMKKDKARYFGPFTSATAVKDTIELINRLYLLRTCNRVLPRDIGKERPCLNFHIKKCSAPCQGYLSQQAYGESIEKALAFLNGDHKSVIRELQSKMEQASEELRFEDAIEIRELLNSIHMISQKQKITDSGLEDKDIIAIAKEENDAVVQVFFIRNGKLLGREHFYMTHVSGDKEPEILSDFVKQYYAGTPFIPKELMLQMEIPDLEIIEQWLMVRRGNKVKIRIPKIGSKEKLVELASQNAALILGKDRERMKREESRTIGAMRELETYTGLNRITRIEAFDISNISGFETVGSMIVYEKGKPKKSDYRKFKIKTVVGQDDYASMREVLLRRFQHGLEEQKLLDEKEITHEMGSFTKFPDLIMMDGGKGQVNIAKEVLQELNLVIPVCGMVKDDHHRTRALFFQNEEIEIEKGSEGFRLITRIQDEAHRFAIEYHRALRGKAQVKSRLDDIPGIGPARRKELMRNFESLEEIRAANIERLMEVKGITKNVAESIFLFFHSD